MSTSELTNDPDTVPELKRLSTDGLEKLYDEKRKGRLTPMLPFRVICTKSPGASVVCPGDYADFEAPDESHARRMFIQQYELDPLGDGTVVLYNFIIKPLFEDKRMKPPYTEESIKRHQEEEAKLLEESKV